MSSVPKKADKLNLSLSLVVGSLLQALGYQNAFGLLKLKAVEINLLV